jgi:hypothetical protein
LVAQYTDAPTDYVSHHSGEEDKTGIGGTEVVGRFRQDFGDGVEGNNTGSGPEGIDERGLGLLISEGQ